MIKNIQYQDHFVILLGKKRINQNLAVEWILRIKENHRFFFLETGSLHGCLLRSLSRCKCDG